MEPRPAKNRNGARKITPLLHSLSSSQAPSLESFQWAAKMAEYGAGEVLLTSMDRDGTRDGFELVITRAITDSVDIPVIASGGVGTLQHLADGVTEGGADR